MQRNTSPLNPAAVRRLRPVAPAGNPPDSSLTLATATFAGTTPPHVTTEVRPLGRRGSWEVIVKATGASPGDLAPRFTLRRLRRRRRGRAARSLVMDAFRPPWVGFRPAPRLLPRQRVPEVRHRGKRLEPLHVIGNDDRHVYQDLSFPWGCVCKIRSGSRTGSGVLVGPRHVLTASHVIDWGAKRATVEVHRFDDFTRAVSGVVAAWAFEEISSFTYSNVDEDYAVLILADRLGDRFGWFGWKTYDSAWDDKQFWWTIGYADNVASARRPLYERAFHLDEDEFDYGAGRAMTSGGDHCKGQSGSPIFGFWPKGPYVVAVVSSEGDVMLSGTENWCAGGSQLTQLIWDARNGDP